MRVINYLSFLKNRLPKFLTWELKVWNATLNAAQNAAWKTFQAESVILTLYEKIAVRSAMLVLYHTIRVLKQML